MRGYMLWFNETKNFGFIRTEGGERLYVHRSGFMPGHAPAGRCSGMAVSFVREVAGVDQVPCAVGVTMVDEAAAGRARRHSRAHAGG
jgi:cold shock CspA family protein